MASLQPVSLLNELPQWNPVMTQSINDPIAYVQRGMAQFKQGQINASIEEFDCAERLNSRLTPRLWQRGLSYYYADRFAEGASQFETDLTVNGSDVEETVWRFLCIARLSGFAEAQQTLLAVGKDSRPIMRSIYSLFAGQTTPEAVLQQGEHNSHDRFYSHLYVGLYWEAMNQPDKAQFHITQAARLFQTDYRSSDDYMGYLAIVHCQQRNWSI